MSNYDNTNRGSVWKNERKTTDKHPDFTGSANVDGVEYWVSMWKRKADANPKAPPVSFTFKRKDEAAKVEAKNDDPDDSIPF